MLRVTVEIFPFGNVYEARKLGTMFITNVGGTHKSGNYSIRLLNDDDMMMRYAEKVYKHDRSRPFWNLIKKAIAKMEKNI